MNARTHRFLSGVAAAGVLLFAVAMEAGADATSPTIIVYTPESSKTPLYRVWNGQSWGSPASMPTIGESAHWMIAKNCPTRNETTAVMLDKNFDLFVTRFDGTTWTAATKICSTTGNSSLEARAFDVAYENSGDLLVVYWNLNALKLGYRTSSGGSISNEQFLELPETSGVMWVGLFPVPGRNQAVMLVSNSNGRLFGSWWNGSAWGVVSTLTNDLSSTALMCFGAAFEETTGEGVVLHGVNGSAATRYRTIVEGVFGASLQGPSLGGESTVNSLKVVHTPGTNTMLAVALDNTSRLNSAFWNGSSWSTKTEVVRGLEFNDRQNFDIAYEPGGARALLIHSQSGVGTISHRVWSNGAWGSGLSRSNGGATNALFALFPGAAGTSDIFAAINGSDSDLMHAKWNGTALSTHTDLHGTIEGFQRCQAFSVAAPRALDSDEPGSAPSPMRVTQWTEVDPRDQ